MENHAGQYQKECEVGRGPVSIEAKTVLQTLEGPRDPARGSVSDLYKHLSE